ncbi:uncharacterized protein ttc6 isoform X2 [Hoplias malabaricus]|uniref:uncharacterized protein ttc6 isoform X2 n=1 Tax=Hoplias malabaricus TaxID=27720 RepID=UPI003463137F
MRKSIQSDVPQEDTFLSAKSLPNHGTGQEAAMKPAITSLTGTARLVYLSKRPQPPAKPRSERPSPTGGAFKNCTHSQKVAGEKKKGPCTQVQRSSVLSRGHLLESSSDESTAEREDLASEESGQNGHAHRKASKKKKRQRKDTQQEQTIPSRCSDCLKSSSASSTIRSMKSVAELLQEATEIATAPPQQGDHQRAPQEAVLETSVKDRGDTANELITSLQSPSKSKVSSPADLMIKLLKEEQPVLKTDKRVRHPVRTVVWSQKDVLASLQIEGIGEEKHTSGPRPHRPVCSQTDMPASQKGQEPIPMELTNVAVLEARGGSFAPVPRPQTVSQQQKNIQGLSLLETWTPKTDAGEHKSIHHLCTTPARQIMPLELQQASRIYHTQDRLMATPQFHQQRAALEHMAVHSHTQRAICEGVPVECVGATEQSDSIQHLPAQTADTLADWQRIAEYYVEKPRMILCGQAATLCDSQFRMLWSPAPPKFSCAPCVIKDKLFPQYQVPPHDVPSENLMAGLQAVTESVRDQMEMKRSTSMEKVLSRKHKSLMDLRADVSVPLPSPDVLSKEQVKRPFSAPDVTPHLDSCSRLQSKFRTISRELGQVQQQLSPSTQSDTVLSVGQAHGKRGHSEQSSLDQRHSTLQPRRVRGQTVKRKRFNRRTGVSQFRNRASKGGKSLSSANLAFIHEKLKELPRSLSRSESLCELPQKPKRALVHWSSLPLLLEFEVFAAERGSVPDILQPRELVRDIWNSWFNDVFPPLKDNIGSEKQARSMCTVPNEHEEIQTVDRVDLPEAMDEGLTTAGLERDVAELTQTMAKKGRAISLEPHLLDAYWHRHSIYLLRNVPNSALDDLNFIIRHNKKHADAFKSRAEIYRMRGKITLAIFNYTQAIKCQPDDAENYFRRAKMYEKTNNIILAMEDYAKTFAINPARTDALMSHGLHHFHTSNWGMALEDFSLLIKQEPTNVRARTYRGRVFAKLGLFQEAVEDFSLALHLDPNNWLTFYHRGCLLRKIMPDMALRDLRFSLLINDSSENLGAFLHRGLLYTKRQQWQKAIADFEAVIKIDRNVVVAHINLGLIYMLQMDRNYDAIKIFSNALKVDPTNLRVYICRARAYHKVNNLQEALKDLTRAIHMRPDAQDLHIMRGQYLCDMEKFDLATFCIQYTAELNKALGSSLVQQAAVQSFLRNDAKAIACLVEAASSHPSPPILILLGKVQMKAQKFMEAVESFRKALTFLSPSETYICSVPEVAELYFLSGMCYMAQGEASLLPQALEAFSNAVRINPDYADAYHQRGLCRIRLQHSRSVQDFNRALSINPNFFQVYLSLAAFYGTKGRYSKAILNCNEAIRIQPKSARAYLYRGALKFHSKVYTGAVKDFTMAIRINSVCSFAYYNRGVCYQKLQEYERALQDYSIVLHLPSQKEIELKVLINRALVYVELNDHYSALQDFKAASVKHPDASICHSLGVYYHRLGQLQEAVEAYSEALRLNPFLSDAYVGRGTVFMDYGHAQASKQAQRNFLSALHLSPQCYAARIGLAYSLQVSGFFQRAWNQFTVAVEVNPKGWIAYEGRAIVSLQMGNSCAAFQDINNALKCHPHSDLLLTNRGVINLFMGDKVSAMRDFQRAISLNPTSALAFFNAGNLFFYNREFEQACEYYSRAFHLDPSDESAVLNRAITHALLRKIPESLQDFSEALSLNPLSAHVYFNRANLFCSLRKYKAAERDFTQALQLQPDDALLYKLRADVRGHLGLTEQAISDYKTAVELQDVLQHLHLTVFNGRT